MSQPPPPPAPLDESLIWRAVQFLRDQSTTSYSLTQKLAFLQRQGLSPHELAQALARAKVPAPGSAAPLKSLASKAASLPSLPNSTPSGALAKNVPSTSSAFSSPANVGSPLLPQQRSGSSARSVVSSSSSSRSFRWYIGVFSVSMGVGTVAHFLVRRWATKRQKEILEEKHRIEIIRIKKLHRREISALKEMYEERIDELTRRHRDDLIAVSKVVTSLGGDLKKALGAVGEAVKLVNKFQAEPHKFILGHDSILSVSGPSLLASPRSLTPATVPKPAQAISSKSSKPQVLNKAEPISERGASLDKRKQQSSNVTASEWFSSERREETRSALPPELRGILDNAGDDDGIAFSAASFRGEQVPHDDDDAEDTEREEDDDLDLEDDRKSVASSIISVHSPATAKLLGTNVNGVMRSTSVRALDTAGDDSNSLNTANARVPPSPTHMLPRVIREAPTPSTKKVRTSSMAVSMSSRRRKILDAFNFLTSDEPSTSSSASKDANKSSSNLPVTLKVLQSMLDNIVRDANNPDSQFRTVRTGGEVFEKHIRFTRGAMEFLLAVGFIEESGRIRYTDKADDAAGDVQYACDLLSNFAEA